MNDAKCHRAPWGFGYAPIPAALADDGGLIDVVVATGRRTGVAELSAASAGLLALERAQPLLQRAPLFWYRLRATQPVSREVIESVLRRAGVPVRYVASALRGSTALGPRLACTGASSTKPERWRARSAADGRDPATEWRWFLRDEDGGIGVERVLGRGNGTRLAVVDDAAARANALELDAEILVGIDSPPRAHTHGALMVAWAVGCRTDAAPFRGVAPGASPRLYLIPKPGHDVVSLPLAIARAVDDGADVVVCATYVEGSVSPMLDDALEFAHRVGRRGRGAAVVFPTGREPASPADAIHASWSLGFGDPASDPRVFCVGPGARGGGWFLWSDSGRLRPFGNRGPAVRWHAPGDDIAYPFAAKERSYHAESSGAAAIAAGVLLLVLEANPSLTIEELDRAVTLTSTAVDPARDAARAPLADPLDILPVGRDDDGHNAKLGYGRPHAGRAALFVSDPVAAGLVAIGEAAAGRTYKDARRKSGRVRRVYSTRLGRWLVRILTRDAVVWHAARAILRHLRLMSDAGVTADAHHAGALTRHLALLLRRVQAVHADSAPPLVRAELHALEHDVGRRSRSSREAVALERELEGFFGAVFAGHVPIVSQRTMISGRRAPSSRDARAGP